MTPSGALGRGAQRFIRNRLGLPLLMSALVIVVVANEVAFRYSYATLTRGIALAEARLQAAALLQAITDAELSAVSFVATGEAIDRERFAAKVMVLPQRLAGALDEIAKVDPNGLVPLTDVRSGVQRRQQRLEGWVALAASGQRDQALAAIGSDISQDAFDTLRSNVDAMLQKAAAIQSTARVNLYNAMEINRWLIHFLAAGVAVWLWLFAFQLRRYDEAQRVAKRELEQAVTRRTGELSDLARHLVSAREDERARVARELHDELGGLLTSMKLEFARLRRSPDIGAAASPRVSAIERRLNEGIALKRRIIEHLRPSSLDQLGLVSSLELLCRDQQQLLGVAVETELEPVRLPPDAELSFFRLVQEAFTNIGKYADAGRVRVRLGTHAGMANIRVEDDGVGFDPAEVGYGHHGLAGIRFRIESHGGRLVVDSMPARGTAIEAWVPSTQAA